MISLKDNNMTARLCEYIAGARDLGLPAHVVLKAKQHILDTFAAMLSGSTLEAGRLMIGYVRNQGGISECQVIGSSIVTVASFAALANGTLAHSDETDDFHAASGTHPGCAVVPAALAIAEREGCDGRSFLRAVVLGYDVGCRVSRALGPRLVSSRGHSSRSIGGNFGAAAAAACLVRLDRTQVGYVLSYAAQQASGIGSYIEAEGHVEKAFVLGGMPARNGVTAATLVQAGFSGVEDVFQGRRNFLKAYSSNPNPAELVRGLGSDFEITQTSIKRFCVGSPIQAPLEGLLRIMSEHGLQAEDVRYVVVRLPENNAATVNDRHMPDINLQYILAVALLDGKLTFEAAHAHNRMMDPRVRDVKLRIQLLPTPELVSSEHPRQAILEVCTRDGRDLREHVTAYRGMPENPMTMAEIEDKARDLVSPVIGKEKCEQLIKMVENLERVTDMREFRSVLAPEAFVMERTARGA
ncbi:MAG: MmgE/PrpD family protein [Deltaproteobacteria bacterium]|nr:MmgE/PrpD family protein [Deltaproteobacteria bacterium]